MAKGVYNDNCEKIYNIICRSEDVMKYLFYKDNVDIEAKEKLTSSQKRQVRENQIFDYEVVTSKSENAECYISMDFETVDCSDKSRYSRTAKTATQREWGTCLFNVYVTCSKNILETKNGNRARALVYIIQKELSGKDIDGFGTCELIGIKKERAVEGYQSYILVFQFVNRLNDYER